MKLYEKEFFIPLVKGHKRLLDYFSDYVPNYMEKNEFPVRFVVTKTDANGYNCELGILSGIDNLKIPSLKSIFDFRKRTYENNEKFNGVLIIPTGIGAEIGGHAGDAGALARLIASTSDILITHPNVVNASDINELPENTLYVEGSVLSRLMMGTIGLQKVRSNHLEVIIDKHEDESFTNAAVNTISAARANLGVSADVLILDNRFKMKSEYTSSGRAAGIIEDLDMLYNELNSRKKIYDAFAISSVIDVAPEIREKYFSGNIVNPWGGIEAILTHATSLLFDMPSAHSPMEPSKEVSELDFGISDPRKAAELVSVTYLYCILKGLYKSPRIITNPNAVNYPGVISAKDINYLVIPEGCLGLPTLAALEQDIPVIAVKNKNLMQNNLGELPWFPGQFMTAKNYEEAIGMIYALKEGISIESVRRPLPYTRILKE